VKTTNLLYDIETVWLGDHVGGRVWLQPLGDICCRFAADAAFDAQQCNYLAQPSPAAGSAMTEVIATTA
jgi:hypothetical protein